MSVSILFTVGTPMGQWAAPATALLAGVCPDQRLALPAFSRWHADLAGLEDLTLAEPTRSQLDALAALPGDGTSAGPWGGVDGRACWTLDALRDGFAQADYLVWVESPVLGLAAALNAGQADVPAEWLATWRAGAQRLLRHIQRDPARCWVVAASEAWRHPEAWQAGFAERFGLLLPPDACSAAIAEVAVADPLCLALASALVGAGSQAQALYAELQASSVLLAAEDVADADVVVDGAVAALRLRELQAGQQAVAQERMARERLAQAQLAVAQARAEAQSLIDARDQALQQAQTRGDELAAERASHRSANEENELLLLELHQVQEELEALCIARRETTELAGAQAAQLEAQLAQAATERDAHAAQSVDLQQQLAGLGQSMRSREAETESLHQRLGALTQSTAQQASEQASEHAAAQAQLVALAAALAQAKAQAETEAQRWSQAREQAAQHALQQCAELDAARASTLAASEESELLLLELHQVQEELEAVCLARRALQTAAESAVPAADGLDLEVGEMRPVAERAALPHRELSFALRQATVAGREIPEAALRLVEHLGHPGLVVFANPQGPQLLDAWQESGREDGRPYALLVPGDRHSQPIFDAMGSTDWLLIQALAGQIVHRLQPAQSALAPYWINLARRLREQLQEMPLRLRFDGLSFETSDDSAPAWLGLRFDRLSCGVRRLDRLTVRWRHSGPQVGIELMCDELAGPPLPHWPIDAEGGWPDSLYLPLSAAGAAEAPGSAASARWSSLSAADLDFVFALLAAMPGAAARIPPAMLRAAQAPDLAAAAAALLGDARRRVEPVHPLVPEPDSANLARRVVRKVRRSAAAWAA